MAKIHKKRSKHRDVFFIIFIIWILIFIFYNVVHINDFSFEKPNVLSFSKTITVPTNTSTPSAPTDTAGSTNIAGTHK